MVSYLTAETNFLRAFGNRSFLLIVLAALCRSGDSVGKAAVPGLSLDINPAIIVVFGPVLALLLVASLKVEADTLLVARLAILDEASELKLRAKVSWLVYLLFAVPTAAAAFIAIQFFLQLVPRPEGCEAWSWARHLFDLRYWEGTPSTYCLGNIPGAPWIYPPLQAYLYLACVSA